jgi:hypothetical protein
MEIFSILLWASIPTSGHIVSAKKTCDSLASENATVPILIYVLKWLASLLKLKPGGKFMARPRYIHPDMRPSDIEAFLLTLLIALVLGYPWMGDAACGNLLRTSLVSAPLVPELSTVPSSKFA